MKRIVKKTFIAILLLAGLPLGQRLPAAETGSQLLNPMGQPPVIQRVPMADRLDSLAGKTIYIVDIGFTDTHQLLTEIQGLMGDRFPDTKWEIRKKIGVYFQDDPELWEEIRQNGDGMIIGVGH